MLYEKERLLKDVEGRTPFHGSLRLSDWLAVYVATGQDGRVD